MTLALSVITWASSVLMCNIECINVIMKFALSMIMCTYHGVICIECVNVSMIFKK